MSQTASYPTSALQGLVEKQKIATLAELKRALGTPSTMTVFRKLKQLGYLSSYSHRGQYYTLRGIPVFDERGLWHCRLAWFSRYGNLVATAQELVERAEGGLSAGELEGCVHVPAKEPLLKLFRAGRLERQAAAGVYIYYAMDSGRQRQQKLQRREWVQDLGVAPALTPAAQPEELKAALVLFFSLLDEQQRRLYAGLEAHRLGHGGDEAMAELLGVDAHTVARGRQELFAGQVWREGIRRPGGGRKPVEKKRHRFSWESSS